jgi:hypothetical protein
MKWINKDKATFRNQQIPEYMWSGIELYLDKGIIPGSFLSAVICNDLKLAFAFADSTNINNIGAYANFFYNYTPNIAWGSKERMCAWAEMKQKEENSGLVD